MRKNKKKEVLPEEFITCPKCGYESGDDWSQCNKSCPMEGSPYYVDRRKDDML